MAMHVRMDLPNAAECILPQTPGGTGIWGNCVFHVNEDIKECDAWIVFDELVEAKRSACPPENALLILGEPPSVHRYDETYLGQFASIVTCQADINHPHVQLTFPPLPWLVGRTQAKFGHGGRAMSYDELKELRPLEKPRLMSIISSRKRITDGHCMRDNFVDAIAQRYGVQLDTFGVGRTMVDDKWDALAPYKYTIAIENCSIPHYWTEKLADAFLASCYVFYWGCPNVGDYFPRGSYSVIDITDVHASQAVIEQRICEDAWQREQDAIGEARHLILDRYNLFAVSAALCAEMKGTQRREVALQPPPPPPGRRLRKKIDKFLRWWRYG